MFNRSLERVARSRLSRTYLLAFLLILLVTPLTAAESPIPGTSSFVFDEAFRSDQLCLAPNQAPALNVYGENIPRLLSLSPDGNYMLLAAAIGDKAALYVANMAT